MLKKITKVCALLLSALFFSVGQASAEVTTDTSEELSQEEFRHNRGLVQLSNQFVPKGQWVTGVTGSYSAHVNDNYTLAVVEGIDSKGYHVKVSPMVTYAYKDNMTAGVRFNYGRSLLRIDDAKLSIGGEDDGVELIVQDFYALEQSYTGMLVARQYIPLGNAKRFALFADLLLEAGGFQSKFANDQPVKGTFAEGYKVGLGISPGIVAFATNDVAFEVSVGMLGVGYSHTDQVHNQVYYGEAESSNMSFSINLLTIGLGVSFYL